nr:DegV family EDD domain-containing protein [Lachnospiraceae bacterium]
MYNISITTECTADLPVDILEKFDIDIIYYDIETEAGLFRDTKEVSANNVMEYMAEDYKKVHSVVPSANDYKSFFERNLKKADEVIHICVSRDVSSAFENAKLGLAKLGMDAKKIHMVDSRSFSSGQGFVAIKAAMLRDEGRSVSDIIAGVNEIIPRINTSFMTINADYLYYNGK